MRDALEMQKSADEYVSSVEKELRELPSIGDDLLDLWRGKEADWLTNIVDQHSMRGNKSPYQVEETYSARCCIFVRE